jgi:HPt (histidine-containing phosphotransfer) domain-containing protein
VSSILGYVQIASLQGEAGFHAAPDAALPLPAPTAVGWPEIDGIDAADARARFNNDVDLFRSMLARLLGEFTDVVIPATVQDAGTLAVHAGRMHKLKGCAGMLGAKAIHELAGQGETACIAGEAERARHLATTLGAEIHMLRQCAAPLFEAAQARSEEPTLPLDELEPRLLAGLVDLLRDQSLSALDRFRSLSPQLRRLLGKESYELLHHHIDNLRFSDAVKVLKEIQTRDPGP